MRCKRICIHSLKCLTEMSYSSFHSLLQPGKEGERGLLLKQENIPMFRNYNPEIKLTPDLQLCCLDFWTQSPSGKAIKVSRRKGEHYVSPVFPE